MLIIPFRDPSSWRELIQLSGVQFYLNFTWNALNEFWMMDVYDANDLPLVLGVKIVINVSLLDIYALSSLPAGDIVCQNIVGGSDIIGRFDMSQNFLLVYYEPGEIDQLQLESANAV